MVCLLVVLASVVNAVVAVAVAVVVVAIDVLPLVRPCSSGRADDRGSPAQADLELFSQQQVVYQVRASRVFMP